MTPELDLFHFDHLLTEEQRMVRNSVRAFVDARLIPVIREHYRAGSLPSELLSEMAALGVFGATLNGWGCAGLGNIAYGLIMQELERGDSGIRSFASVQSGLVMHPIHEFGTPAQKDRWLGPLARGEAIGCFGLTEADFGSNPGGMRTCAQRDGTGWIINGSKMWITNGSIADICVVFARTGDHIRGFLAEKGTPGFSASDVHGKLSLRASVTSELVFEDCRIPAENELPGAIGLRAAFSCLNRARYGIAWGAVGAAIACFDEALQFSRERVQFGHPIAGFQLVQAKLAQMYTGIVQAQLLVYRLGQLAEAGELDPVCISVCKRNNVEMALKTARTARDILGAAGIVDDHVCMRHLCNLESVYTYEGTHDIHTLIIGQRLTGIPAFR